MAGITTAMLAAFKRELLNGNHSFAQTRTFTATGVSTQTWTGLSSLAGVYVGLSLSGANVAANTIVSKLLSGTSIRVSEASTGAIGTVTVTGDTFKMALIKSGMSGTYGPANTSYLDIGADEVVGAGYTAGGTNLTNVDPVASSPSAYTTFSPNPSWTSATISTAGCMIYNASVNSQITTPGCSVHDFGGTQTVTSGTLTVLMPVAAVGTAVLQIT